MFLVVMTKVLAFNRGQDCKEEARNSQRCTGQAPTAKNYLAPNVSSAEFEKP